ncbi:MAG: hypothetical protein CMP39_03810 [Rickettsiales bacterium]|nr:hypothetical protein [Rickettsiales bacterium]
MFKLISIKTPAYYLIENKLITLIQTLYPNFDTIETQFKPKIKIIKKSSINNLIIFIHGLGACAEENTNVMEYMKSKNYHCIALALPYHISKKPPKEKFSIAKREIFINETVKTLNELETTNTKIHLVGSSFGASFAKDITEKLSPNIKKTCTFIAPFLDVYRLKDSLTIKSFDFLDKLNGLGTKLSTYMTDIKRNGHPDQLGWYFLKPQHILNAYQQVRTTFNKIPIYPITIFLTSREKTVSNELTKTILKDKKIITLDHFPHNMLIEKNQHNNKHFFNLLNEGFKDKKNQFHQANTKPKYSYIPDVIYPMSYRDAILPSIFVGSVLSISLLLTLKTKKN